MSEFLRPSILIGNKYLLTVFFIIFPIVRNNFALLNMPYFFNEHEYVHPCITAFVISSGSGFVHLYISYYLMVYCTQQMLNTCLLIDIHQIPLSFIHSISQSNIYSGNSNQKRTLKYEICAICFICFDTFSPIKAFLIKFSAFSEVHSLP